jgi:hypothetical protein
MKSSVPAAVPIMLLVIFAIPKNFPHHGQPDFKPRTYKTLISKVTRERVDIVGAGLLLCATLSLTSGFEEVGSRYKWRSAYFISLVTISGLLWIALLVWEWRLTLLQTKREPVLPWRLVTDRVVLGLIL